jgi:hypothetical protein
VEISVSIHQNNLRKPCSVGTRQAIASMLILVASSAHAADRLPRYDRMVALDKIAVTTGNVSTGDLNGDGHLDIVIANGRHWPLISRVFFGNGAGQFSAGHDLGEAAFRSYSGHLADMDGDGSLDIVLSNDLPDPKLIYLNNGKGQFRAGPHYGSPEWPTRNATLVDLDDNGATDIVVANRSEDIGNFICMNRGSGKINSCLQFSKEPATTITAADFNRDGSVDLAVPHRDGGQSYIYLAEPKASYSASRRIPFGPPDAGIRMTEAGDFDGDGLLDLVAIEDERKTVTLVFGRKDGTFSQGVPIDNGNVVPYGLAASDLNGDGKLDFVVGNVAAPSTVFFNQGSGRDFTPVQFHDSIGVAFGFSIADFDKDGLRDIAVARSNGINAVYFASKP